SGLESFCTEIHSYKRENFLSTRSPGLPYIIRSRKNSALVKNLNKDNYPILLEGLHCSGILYRLNPERKVVLRMHNDEGLYYRRLAATERNLVKSSYYAIESMLIERYMSKLPAQLIIASVSTTDME